MDETMRRKMSIAHTDFEVVFSNGQNFKRRHVHFDT
jgi:hypothetical protein